MAWGDGFRAADRLMAAGVVRRQFQSAVLLVGHGGQIALHEAYGRARLDSVFDLASLTKPLATVAALMQLAAQSKVDLASPLEALLDELRGRPAGRCLIWQLLSHSSGLPAWRPYYETLAQAEPARARAALFRRLCGEPLVAEPGVGALYSDLGFMLLGFALERVAGETLDRLAHRLVFGELGLTQTGFGPRAALDAGRAWCDESALVPTERIRAGARLRGEVHDDNCRAVGGVCGHAGLFSSAYDVHLLARELIAAYQGRRSIFSAEVVRRHFDTRPVPNSSWALGWDTPHGVARPSCGRHFGVRSVGHLGFTGTSLWIDLQRATWIVLLTNRVYYGREPNPMKHFRPRLHDAVMRALRGRQAVRRG